MQLIFREREERFFSVSFDDAVEVLVVDSVLGNENDLIFTVLHPGCEVHKLTQVEDASFLAVRVMKHKRLFANQRVALEQQHVVLEKHLRKVQESVLARHNLDSLWLRTYFLQDIRQ